jgi:rsbT antagonist protein RsbS
MSTTAAKSTGQVQGSSGYVDVPAVAIQVSRDVVVASIQVDLDDAVLARFRDDLLRRIQETDASGVIFDLSGLETLDCYEFAGLRGIVTMAKIMGAESVLVGLKPGVVSALIAAGAEVDGLLAAIDLDAAYALLTVEPGEEAESECDLPSAANASPPDAAEPEPAQVQGLEL